jgi:hypothetical protein
MTVLPAAQPLSTRANPKAKARVNPRVSPPKGSCILLENPASKVKENPSHGLKAKASPKAFQRAADPILRCARIP